MASVAPPLPSLHAAEGLRLPNRLIAEGHLSEAQLETIIMANDAHRRHDTRYETENSRMNSTAEPH